MQVGGVLKPDGAEPAAPPNSFTRPDRGSVRAEDKAGHGEEASIGEGLHVHLPHQLRFVPRGPGDDSFPSPPDALVDVARHLTVQVP